MADKIIDLNDDTEENSITERGLTATGITAITQAAAAVVTVANDFVDGDIVEFSAAAGMTQINGKTATVSSASASGFTTDIDTAFTAEAAVVVDTTDNLSPAVIETGAAHGLAVGDSVFIYGLTEHTELNNLQWLVNAVTDADTFTIDYDATGDTDEATGGFMVRVATDAFGAYTGTAGLATVVGNVDNTVRIAYDDSKTRSQIVDSIQRGKEFVTKTNAGV